MLKLVNKYQTYKTERASHYPICYSALPYSL